MTGLRQVAFTSIFGFLIGFALGLDALTSLYVAVALTFSSTINIVKLLSDKREIDSLHGQIAFGFLIVQDLVVVLAMIVLPFVGIGSGDGHDSGNIFVVLASRIALVGLVALFIRYAANPLTEKLTRAPELLVMFAILGDHIYDRRRVGGAWEKSSGPRAKPNHLKGIGDIAVRHVPALLAKLQHAGTFSGCGVYWASRHSPQC